MGLESGPGCGVQSMRAVITVRSNHWCKRMPELFSVSSNSKVYEKGSSIGFMEQHLTKKKG